MTLDKEKSSSQVTVLVVTDDNKDKDVDSLTRLLVRHDMSVLRAYNGPECLEIVRTHPIDVVLLDVKMPGIAGPAVWAVWTELTQIAPALPIILVNEDDMATRAARLVAAGVRRFSMTLPADLSVRISDYAALLARIQGQLAVRRYMQEVNRAPTAIAPTKPPGTKR